jgi:hypothetical protein
VKRLGISAVVVSLLAVAAALALLLWPLHANGVEGSALIPRYSRYFTFATFEPVPDHATEADLRRAGVRFPQDVVWHRRDIAFGLIAGAIGVIAIGATLVIVKRRRSALIPPAAPEA